MVQEEELRQELKDAMRAKDKPRLNVIRQVLTDVTNKRTEPKAKDDPQLVEKVLGAYVKRMAKAVDEYSALGDKGAEMVTQLQWEVDYLSKWLPQLLSEEETLALVKETIAELGVSDPAQAGRVIGVLMKSRKDLDGKLVGSMVKEALT